MHLEGDDLNPYAAPNSNVTPPKEESSLPRPASTKWLLGLMWLLSCGVVILLIQDYQKEGAAFLHAFKSLQSFFSGSLLVFTIVAFHAFKRSRITYALGMLYLLLLSYIMWMQMSGAVRTLAVNWNRQIDKTQIWADVFVTLVFTALIAKLCYHFIFGLPSRRFYRLTQK